MTRSLVYHLVWFVPVVFIAYSTIIYTIQMVLSGPVRFVVVGLLVVAIAVIRELVDQALERGREG